MEAKSLQYRPKTITRRGAIAGLVKLPGLPAFDPASVLYLEGNGNYTLIHFSNGQKHLVSITLTLVASQLPTLIRVHKSYAIAAAGVTKIRWGSQAGNRHVLVVTMLNKVQITVPRRRSNGVATELAQCMGIVIKE